MEGSRENLVTLDILGAQRAFENDPFVLMDVGCSGGISQVWREFGNDLVAYGFDPQQSECRRLQAAEPDPRIEYVPSYVGLRSDHELVRRRAAQDQRIFQHFNPWNRLSVAAASRLNAQVAPQAQPIFEDVVAPSRTVGIAEFVEERQIGSVDFIKIDVDGTDLDCVVSAEPIVRSRKVLGFAVEVNWTGSYLDTDNTFHNIDRQLRQMGFSLVSVTQRHYSREHLPAPFLYEILAQSPWGQPIQGDAIYLRDAASVHDGLIWGSPLSPTKLLKLVVLADMFALPDLAAEILVTKRQLLETRVDVDRLLDAITPLYRGQKVSYADYVGAFRQDPANFLPSRWKAAEAASAPAVSGGGSAPSAPSAPAQPAPAQPGVDPAALDSLGARVAQIEAQLADAAARGAVDPDTFEQLSARVEEIEEALRPQVPAAAPAPAGPETTWSEDVQRLAARTYRGIKRRLTS